ncbi:ISAzo13 family transposase [Nocardia sp. CA-129566]|uniref:ISAzo13 family transposase n=1 Tax=Nocardia sp. CA-129566 TaxID=3239976 RepID=UPI003D97ABA6
MRDFVVTVEDLAVKFGALLAHLDERQRRLVLAAEARMLGRGGGRAVAVAAGVREATVSKGVAELEAGEAPLGRVRRRGGGRKRLVEVDPGLRSALLSLVEPDERGDPMSPLRWTTKSTRALAGELAARGHRVSADVVADLLREEGFSLQANAKTIEGARHADRDDQFRYLNDQVKDHQDTGDPVVSVDTKKKELIGRYAGGGREWRPSGEPLRVNTHDFPDAELGKAIPYGIYDLAANSGWVNVGIDHDTAAFAVESLRRWWRGRGRAEYPDSQRLLITADAGGSNSYRTRAWKTELAGFATETGLHVTVCHFPPGTSKWNKVEHRLFSHITMNWRGRPLTSHEVVLNTIAATTTGTGLRVHAELDTGNYPTGVKIDDNEFSAVPITRHDWHGDWNYTIAPEPVQPTIATDDTTPPVRPDTTWLRAPALTGLTPPEWDELIQTLTVTRHAQREARLQQRRGGTRQTAPGTGRRAVLTLDDRLAITLLYQRFSTNQRAPAKLFTVNQQTIHNVIAQTKPLLTLAGHTIHPTGITLTDAISQYHSGTTESD